jgi:hypothetical protein
MHLAHMLRDTHLIAEFYLVVLFSRQGAETPAAGILFSKNQRPGPLRAMREKPSRACLLENESKTLNLEKNGTQQFCNSYLAMPSFVHPVQ